MKLFLLTFLFLVVCIPHFVFADETITFATSTNDNTTFGNASPNVQQTARSFTPSGNDGSAALTVSLTKTGAPSDNAVVQLQVDVAGSPSGVSLGSASIAAATITTSCATYTFSTISSLALLSGVKYWLVLGRSGTLDTSNMYRVCIKDGDVSPVTKDNTGIGPTWQNQIFGDWFGSVALTSPAAMLGGVSKTTINFVQFILLGGTTIFR